MQLIRTAVRLIFEGVGAVVVATTAGARVEGSPDVAQAACTSTLPRVPCVTGEAKLLLRTTSARVVGSAPSAHEGEASMVAGPIRLPQGREDV